MGLLDKFFGPSAEQKKRVEELQKRLRTNPSNVACALALADALVETGQKPQAIKLLNQMGPVLQKNGQFLAAITVYKRAGQLDPKAEVAGTAISLRELKRLEAASQSQTLPAVVAKRPEGVTAEEAARTQAKRDSIHPLLQNIPLFKDVSPHLFDQLIEKIHIRTYDAGQTLFNEGAPGSSLLFIVQGEISVTGKGEQGEDVPLRTLGPGDVAGEMSFLSSLPRSATLRTKAPSAILELERRAVDPLVRKSPGLRDALNRLYKERVLNDVLTRSTLFSTLPPEARDEIASRLSPVNFEAGSTVPASGGEDETLYLIAQGLVRITTLEGSLELERAILSPPAFFGSATPGVDMGSVVATAITDIELFALKLRDVGELMQKYARIRRALDELQAERLRSRVSTS